MKITIKTAIVIFFHILCHTSTVQIHSQENSNEIDEIQKSKKIILLSFPRSGTNLTSCYIQALTKRPIRFLNMEAISPATNRLNLDLNYNKEILIRAHKGFVVKKWNKNGNKLIFLLRNYKEAIHRESNVDNPEEFEELFFNQSSVFQLYTKNLKVFHNWDRDHRLIIYYEDLVNKPLPEVKKILAFLGENESEDLTEDFLKQVAKKSLESYHNQHIDTGGAQSKGSDLFFHSKKMPSSCLIGIDKWIKKKYPCLWQLYLHRYQTFSS